MPYQGASPAVAPKPGSEKAGPHAFPLSAPNPGGCFFIPPPSVNGPGYALPLLFIADLLLRGIFYNRILALAPLRTFPASACLFLYTARSLSLQNDTPCHPLAVR